MNKVFIGHGHSLVWLQLQNFLEKHLKLAVEQFNSVSVAGVPTATRLEQMLDIANFAFLVMTAEDETSDGKVHARLNVVHEAGLFQGKLGFKKAIILLEDGCEDFSNIDGLGYIKFPKGNIAPIFEEIRQVLEREEATSSVPTPPLASRASQIEILFEKRSPYEVTDVQHGRVLSTVRIGILNRGTMPLSNCKVYIDKLSPEPSLPGGLPILLEGGGFTLRHDDPEKLVDIATHWDHVDRYRFSAPLGGGFSDSLTFIDDKISRTLVVRVEARECQRSAAFRIATDDSRGIHLEHIGYVG